MSPTAGAVVVRITKLRAKAGTMKGSSKPQVAMVSKARWLPPY